MAFSHGIKQIVSDGLVLALDAGNHRSYPGSGTAWTDLSGNGNDGTLINGPTFDSANGGMFTLDASDEKITGPSSTTIFTNNSFTIEGWVNPNTTPKSEQVWFAAVGPVGGTNKDIHLRIFSSGQLRFGFFADDLDSAGGVVSFGEWNHLVYTYDYDSDNSKIYHNGTEVASGTQGGFNDTSAFVNIGYWQTSSGQTLEGSVSTAKVYNRALTAEEVLQNYNVLKSRFGL